MRKIVKQKNSNNRDRVNALTEMIEYISIETKNFSPVTTFILQMAMENLRDEATELPDLESGSGLQCFFFPGG